MRAPLPFAVQLGERRVGRPHPPALLRRLAASDDDISTAFTTLQGAVRIDGDLRIEERRVGPPSSDVEFAPLRVLVMSRGEVFAVVILPEGAEGEATYGSAVAGIARTLRATSAATSDGPTTTPSAVPVRETSPGGR